MGLRVMTGRLEMKPLVLGVPAEMEWAATHPLQIEVAAVAAVLLGDMEVPAVLASCASGYTRKRNNKLKGERLCTTL